MWVLVAIAAFGITFAEAWITTRGTQAVMRARDDPSPRNCHRGAAWDTLFEVVLFVDVLIVVGYRWSVIPIVIGAYLGTYLSLRHPPPKP